jgi:hypothetical protein
MCSVLYTGPFSLKKRMLVYYVIPTAMVALLIGPITPGTTPGSMNGFVEGVLILIPVVYVFFVCLVVLIDSMIIWICRAFSHFLTKADGHRPPLH